MRWPLHYWRKDYHQFNVAKILLSHTHEGIASSRANDDPPLFSLDNGKLSPSRNWTLNLPLCNPKLLSTEWAKNVAKILLSHAHEGIVSLWWPSFVFPGQWTTSPSRDWTLNRPLCDPKLLSTEWANLQPQFYCNVLHQTFTFAIA